MTLQLVRWGIATGNVLGAPGQPLARAVVVAARRGYNDFGEPQYQIVPGIQGPQVTDDRGQFRFFQLEPGEYYFAIEPQIGLPTREPDPNFQPVFYPGVTDPSLAAPLQISAGQETRLGSIVVPKRNNSTVRLRVINQTGEELRNRTMTTRSTLWNRVNSTTLVGASGPGNTSPDVQLYTAMMGAHEIALSWETDRGIAIGRARIDTTQVETDLMVRIGGTVNGIVHADRPERAELPNVDCRLNPRNVVPGRLVASLSGRTDSDGLFRIKVPVGNYHLSCSNLPKNTYLAEVTDGTRDVLGEGFSVDQDTDLRILVRTGSVVYGQVVDSAGNAAADAIVVLVPDASVPGSAAFYRTATTDQHGAFDLDAVAPGHYQLFAWPELPGAAYRNQDFMRSYEHRGRALEVGANGLKQEVTITLE